MNKITILSLALLVVLTACDSGAVGTSRSTGASGDGEPESGATTPGAVATASGVENTFDHPAAIGGAATTPREAMRRMEEEGPPGYSARVHSCRKVRYGTLGRLLRSRGVDLEAEGSASAGAMWRTADQALGAPNYGARIGESTEMTVASASRMFDIFVQAAPEIIASLPSRTECTVGGVGAGLFDASGRCTQAGISCLLGVPATPAHLTICDDTVRRAATPAEGQAIAVAALLSAAFTCE
jgi:hypothetical protein